MRTQAVMGLLVGLIALPVYAAKPQIQWNEEYDFDAIETFQWQATPNSSLEERNPFMHSRIVAAIEYEITSGGFGRFQTRIVPSAPAEATCGSFG